MEMRAVRALFLAVATIAAAVLAFAISTAGAADAAPRVLVIEFENDVNPVTAQWAVDQLERAQEERYDAVVIELDTPGGLADAMRDIYKEELASTIPVIVYVSPAGARAASAGVWIGQAADVLPMAPQTNLGSSTPVSSGGGEIPSDLRRKVINDAAASLRELAEEHDRNGDWAERAVRVGDNIGAREALREDVIDVIAPTLPELLDRIDGRRTVPKELVLDTAGARIERVEMGLWKRILDVVIDPNIITLMLSIGLLGIVVELWNPGLVFPGTVGGISLIVGLYGLQVLPVSAAGILLMLLALGFWVAELFVVSHGALALAGTVAAFMALAVTKLVQIRRKPVEVGVHSLVGTAGVVRGDEFVFANGELWRARDLRDTGLRPGDPVVIESVDDKLVVEVRPAEEPQPAAEAV